MQLPYMKDDYILALDGKREEKVGDSSADLGDARADEIT
jgi:hypothetical protein